MALTGSEHASGLPPGSALTRLRARLGARFNADALLMHRLAGTAFLIRVVAAALAYGSQVLFARWMGSFEFGIFVYVWTWVLLIGQGLDLGLSTAAQRFIPQYRELGQNDRLRGFVAGSRRVVLGVALVAALGCAGLVRLLQPWLDDYTVIPLYLACIALPAYAFANVQDGIARSYDWIGLALLPNYIVRQGLLTALMAGAYFGGFPVNAVTALILGGASIWAAALWQLYEVNKGLRGVVERGPKRYETRTWIVTAMPILLVEGFFLLLTYTDVLVLQIFRSPEEIATYYAAAKTLALVAFINFAITATTAHRFSTLHVNGDRAGLSALLAQAIRWTFWPSLTACLVLLAFGKPILSLFGASFVAGYPLMFVIAAGLLARASVGPIERMLSMLGEQRICAMVYAGAFTLNLALCFALIPYFGAMGAAISTVTAQVFESILLFIVTRRRLKLHAFMWGAPPAER